ncbi:hypothetical protein AQUSIP_09450 [Aquicella siphonis]|uniref:Uncharacterized protein n=1 Tax=Aquicella siphonis TaxID=254247 RepID=A0A5E4PG94_9COXI|nr:DUF692 domain-containing protein [Aquicella siphonis]VVC75655.1 hypothetical protein AQUSIP_09450 [Aquicella siphonis]
MNDKLRTDLFGSVGVGLRACHYAHVELNYPAIPWFEVLSDNYLFDGGPGLRHLEKIRAAYPVTLHGVGMSLGSTDVLNWEYFRKLKSLIQRVEPVMVSDHLCWTSFGGQYFHELLPLPYTEEAVRHTAGRIRAVQDFLGQRIMIENVSSYFSCRYAELNEWEFLQAVADEADCFILLDINNIYVSARSHHFNPEDYIAGLNSRRIRQFHLAGFEDRGTHLLDTHSAPVHAPVWELFRQALSKWGAIPAIIEWDNQIPAFERLQYEAAQAQEIMTHHVNFARVSTPVCDGIEFGK